MGWFVIGSDNTKKSDAVSSISFVEPLNTSKFYELETLGVQARDCSCSRAAMLSNKAIDLMESSCKRLGNRYTVSLPWKKDKSLLPDNYPLAEKRLFSLERNLLKDEAKAKLYDNAMMEYERNGWARRLNGKDLEAKVKPVHYLPHHGIYRPDKKSIPLKIVFDPACQYQGVSLNSFLHKGPGLIGNLLPLWGTSRTCTSRLSYQKKTNTSIGSSGETWIPQEKPDESPLVPTAVNLDGEKGVKTLGLGWNPQTDVLSFAVKETKIAKLTKRAVLSNISRLWLP